MARRKKVADGKTVSQFLPQETAGKSSNYNFLPRAQIQNGGWVRCDSCQIRDPKDNRKSVYRFRIPTSLSYENYGVLKGEERRLEAPRRRPVGNLSDMHLGTFLCQHLQLWTWTFWGDCFKRKKCHFGLLFLRGTWSEMRKNQLQFSARFFCPCCIVLCWKKKISFFILS